MARVYTKFRNLSHDFSLFTIFREHDIQYKLLIFKGSTSWHESCTNNEQLVIPGPQGKPAQPQGVIAMKNYKQEGLALAGMLVVLLGVMFAAAATVA